MNRVAALLFTRSLFGAQLYNLLSAIRFVFTKLIQHILHKTVIRNVFSVLRDGGAQGDM